MAGQLIWFAVPDGQRQNRLRATAGTRVAIRLRSAGGSPSASRASHAAASASITSASMTMCWPASGVRIEPTQPGAWRWVQRPPRSGGSRGMYGGLANSAATSRRARSSWRAGPWWPRSAAIECVSRRLALAVVSVPPTPSR